MIVIPTTYFGDVALYARLAQAGGEECVIDLHEHYIKRSQRNRTTIMTANGTLDLSVPLLRANRPQTPVAEVRIDYSTRWQHRHWTAITSAYRSSGWWDMVADRLEPFYVRRWERLADYNMDIMGEVLDLAGISPDMRVSQRYVDPSEARLDLRPKKGDISVEIPPYFQLFSDRMPFAPNLSILDLLMCEGTATASFLGNCRL